MKNRDYKTEYQRHKPKRQKYAREYARRIREAVIVFLGGKCVRCSFADARALQVDHVDGAVGYYRAGGSKDPKQRHKDRGVWMHIRILHGSYPHRVQLLCANCNWIKRFENGEHN